MKPPVLEGVLEIPLSGPAVRRRRASGREHDGAGRAVFFAGPENRLVEHAVAVALGPRRARSFPIVLHGGTGTGKTHLARGIVEAWKKSHPRRRAEYFTASDFVRALHDALDAQAIEEFRSRLRDAELLVIDDVQRLAEKHAAEDELVHTIDALDDRGGRLILACSAPPGDLRTLPAGLRSRLQAGLAVPLVRPGATTRLALLRQAARLRGVQLDDAAAGLLAEELEVPVPGLLGALNELQMLAQVDGGVIDRDRAKHYLAHRRRKCPKIPEIAAATARKLSVRVSDLRSASRRQAVVTARAVAMYLARRLTRENFQQIGQYFGGRDHTTVIHNCRKAERLLRTDPGLSEAVRQLQAHWETP